MLKKLQKDKRGVVGLNTGKKFLLAIMVMAILGFVAIIVLQELDSANPAAAGSLAANQSTNIIQNVTGGVDTFFSNAITWFSLLAIVILILIVVIVMKSVSGVDRNKGGL
jgi:preprotein translocase subunit SecG